MLSPSNSNDIGLVSTVKVTNSALSKRSTVTTCQCHNNANLEWASPRFLVALLKRLIEPGFMSVCHSGSWYCRKFCICSALTGTTTRARSLVPTPLSMAFSCLTSRSGITTSLPTQLLADRFMLLLFVITTCLFVVGMGETSELNVVCKKLMIQTRQRKAGSKLLQVPL